jgi:antitoxin (DNA-binding transcriptional repressor) of toxin-antitoxin stability system
MLVTRLERICAPSSVDLCLKTLDDVAKTKTPIIITKRGHPIAKLVPYFKPTPRRGLAGSVLKERGDLFGTGEKWDADAS